MKKIYEQFISLIPLFIFFVLAGSLLIFFYQNHITYEHFSGIINILIWPTIMFFTVLFFRRVFTYLFFSMDEFNFFGTRGKLKDIREVIEERVNLRIKEQKNEETHLAEINKFSNELDMVKKSKGDADKKASEYLEFAKDILNKYKTLSEENLGVKKELDLLRQERADKEAEVNARLAYIRARNNVLHRKIEKNKEECFDTDNSLKANKNVIQTKGLDYTVKGEK